MYRLKALVIKEFIEVFRDRGSIALMIMMPIMQLLIFGFAINTDVKHLKTIVLDQSRSQESRQMLESFRASNYFDIVDRAENFEELNRAVDKGDAKVGIAFPPDFASRLLGNREAQVQVIVDATDSTSASSAIAAASMLGTLQSQKIQRDRLLAAGITVPKSLIDVRIRPWYNPDFVTSWYMVPGIMGILLTMTLVMMMSIAIVRESEQGTLEQLLVTPMRSWELLLSKVLPYIVIGYVQVFVAVFVGIVVFKMPFRGSMALFFGVTIFFMFASLSLGIFLATLSFSQMQAQQMGMLILLPSVLLSGFVFPLEAMPRIFQWISRALPVTYYVRIARQIILKAGGIEYIWRDVLSLIVFSVVVFSVSIVFFKKRFVP